MLTTIPLGFIKSGEDGKSMCENFTKIYEDFVINQNKIFLTTDNCKIRTLSLGSSNKTFIDHLKVWTERKKINFEPNIKWI